MQRQQPQSALQLQKPTMKTNKSYSKRIRITKKGKLVARKPGQDHYNAFETGAKRGSKRRKQAIEVSSDVRRRFLSY